MTTSRLLSTAALLVVAAVAIVAADAPKLPPAASAKVDFDRDVKPILVANCLKCHDGLKQRGGLRLDDRTAFLEGGNGGAVIVVGKSAESRLIHAVAQVDPDTKMP